MKLPYAFFDLDGTIIDSQEGILNAIQVALDHFGEQVPRDQLLGFIGPPLHVSFMQVLGYPEAKALEGLALYRKYYSTRGVFECRLFGGIADCLRRRAQADAPDGGCSRRSVSNR